MRDKSYRYKRKLSGTLVSTGRLVENVHGSSISTFKKITGNQIKIPCEILGIRGLSSFKEGIISLYVIITLSHCELVIVTFEYE